MESEFMIKLIFYNNIFCNALIREKKILNESEKYINMKIYAFNF